MEPRITIHINEAMEFSSWLSAMDSSYATLSFQKAPILGCYAVSRFILQNLSSAEKIALIEQLQRIDEGDESSPDVMRYWMFEATGPEQNTSINRYFRGEKTSVLLRRRDQALNDFVHAHIENNECYWFALKELSPLELKENLWILYGQSRSLLLLSRQEIDSDAVAGMIFSAIRKHRGDLRTRAHVVEILKSLYSMHKIKIGSGFGGEDFGGYFLDVFCK